MASGLLSSLFWFVAVVAAIPLVLWLLKRTPLGGGMAGGKPGAPRVVAVLPLAAQQRLVTVEVGRGDDRLWLVLGVGAQGIRALHTMSAQDDGEDDADTTLPPAPPPPAAAFAQLLRRLGGPGSAKDDGDAR